MDERYHRKNWYWQQPDHWSSPSSHDQCQELSEQLPQDSKVRQRLVLWLQQHLIIQQKITTFPLLISSDIIESLFGKFKYVLQRSPQADMNRTVLLLPALCGNQDEETITEALHQANHADLESWENENIPYTIRKKRQEFFLPLKPKTGELLAAI